MEEKGASAPNLPPSSFPSPSPSLVEISLDDADDEEEADEAIKVGKKDAACGRSSFSRSSVPASVRSKMASLERFYRNYRYAYSRYPTRQPSRWLVKLRVLPIN